MGSFRHPKTYDTVTLQSVRETFHAIMDELDELYVFPVTNRNMKAAIIERLLYFATHDTPQDEWKAAVLSSLPLR
jgi:hypothetical protein